MKYLCLVYGEEKKFEAMDDDECVAYDEALRERGQCLASEALQPVQTATTVHAIRIHPSVSLPSSFRLLSGGRWCSRRLT